MSVSLSLLPSPGKIEDRPYHPASDAAHQTARALLSGVVDSDPECIRAVAELPDAVWPDEQSGAVAEAVRSLVDRKEPVEPCALYTELQALGLADVAGASYLSEVRETPPTINPERCADTLRAEYRRRDWADTSERMRNGSPEEGAEAFARFEARHALVDGDLDADILGASAPPAPVFSNGPTPEILGLVLGESGISKSYLSLGLAVSVSTGRAVFPAFTPRERGSVLYYSYEDSPGILRFRLGAISDACKIPWGEIEAALRDKRLVFRCEPSALFEAGKIGVEATAEFQALRRRMREERPTLVIVDPLANAAILRDENSNAEMASVAGALARLAKKTEASILLVHHSSKGRAGEATQHSARGGSALACASRWIVHLTRRDAENYPDVVMASVVKNSHYRSPDALTFERVDGGALVQVDATRKPETLIPSIVEWLTENPSAKPTRYSISRRQGVGKDLSDEIGRLHKWPTASDVDKAIGLAIQQGEIREEIERVNGKDRRTIVPAQDVPF